VTEELGDKDAGMALCLGAVDPLQRPGRICAEEARGVDGRERRVRSKASGACGMLCLCGWFDAFGRERGVRTP
jgi:hypothetical protein